MFCLIDFLPEKHRAFLRGRSVRTTYLQRVPFVSLSYKYLLSLMPLAIEQLDLSGYDVIISNCHAVAKGCHYWTRSASYLLLLFAYEIRMGLSGAISI